MTIRFPERRGPATALLLGLLLLAGVAAQLLLPGVFEPLRHQTSDRLFRLRAGVEALAPKDSGRIVHVDIDDRGVRSREEFYVGRAEHGRLIDVLSRVGISHQFHDMILAAPQSEEEDRALEQTVARVGGVFFGMAVFGPPPVVEPSEDERRLIETQRWHPRIEGDDASLFAATQHFASYPALASSAEGHGFLDLLPDRDGVVRRVVLLVRDGDGVLPSLALRVVTEWLGVDPATIVVEPGRRIVLPDAQLPGESSRRDIRIPIDAQGRMVVNYLGPWPRLTHYGFTEFLEAGVDRFHLADLRDELAGRMALVAWLTTGNADIGAVPTDPLFPLSEVWGTVINGIVSEQFLRELSVWQMIALVWIPLLAVLWVIGVRLTTIPFVLSAFGVATGWVVVASGLFLFGDLLVDIPGPLIGLVAGTIVVAAYQFHVESRERARLGRELAVARDIQLRTFPKAMPSPDGYEVVGHSEPADEAGGDSYDGIALSPSNVLLLLADATGHGVGPALSVTQVRSMLRMAVRLGADLDTITGQLNDQLSEDLASNRFVTAFVGVLDTETHAIRYHAAGQGPILHFRAADGSCDWFTSTTRPLGFMEGLPLGESMTLELAPGDVLGVMSDGVYECEDAQQEQFGQERVVEMLRSMRERPLEDFMKSLFDVLEHWRAGRPQDDDITVVLVRRRL